MTRLEILTSFLTNGKVIAVAAVVLVILFILLIKAPLKFLCKVAINTICGFILLWIINYFAEFIGFSIPMTWLNALITGVLGLPGVLLIVVLRFLGIMQ